ncbi:SurA N-terminal domain-containing protein [Actinopolymorpha sp. B11F2]|uniref:SurA N-terminal domain-containing protein n=1 Tax=Actinopolymorpha sp. B11F2 TaxID=3160862 RepID=UPI0032E4FA08
MLALRRTPRLTVLAAVVAAGLTLTGCGSLSNPSAAAQVGGETISVSFLQKQLEEILDHSARASDVPGGQVNPSTAELAENQRALLQQLINDSLITETADRLGVTASRADIDKVEDEIRAQQVFIPGDMREEFARWVALRRELNANLLGKTPASQADQAKADQLLGEQMRRTSREVGVTVNPRYGRWDGAQLLPGGQLVEPSETEQPQLPPAGP